MRASQIAFGDRVRVRSTPATLALGIANQIGVVHGHTTPFVTGVEIIGNASDDFAIAVDIEGQSQALWFAEDMLEFVDHSPGMTATVGDSQFVRDEHGKWHETKSSN